MRPPPHRLDLGLYKNDNIRNASSFSSFHTHTVDNWDMSFSEQGQCDRRRGMATACSRKMTSSDGNRYRFGDILLILLFTHTRN